MGSAPAQIVDKGLFDVIFRGLGLVRQQGYGIHHHAIGAVAALCCLLRDKGRLYGMKRVAMRQTFKRCDLFAARLVDGHLA